MEGASYNFQVGPLNGDVHGPPSSLTEAVVVPGSMPVVEEPPAVPVDHSPKPAPARVSGVTATVGTDGGVTVMWEPLAAGTVTSYVILGTREGQPRHAVTDRLPIAPTWHALASDRLVAGAKYTFQVAAVNGDTHGPPSTESTTLTIPARSTTPPPAPSPSHFSVHAILNADNSVSVVWNPTDSSTEHSYTVLSQREDQDTLALTDALPASVTAYTIPTNELVGGSTYMFRVKDSSKEGAKFSLLSNQISIPTTDEPVMDPETAPRIPVQIVHAPPKILGVTGRYAAGNLVVSWDADPTASSYLIQWAAALDKEWHWLPQGSETKEPSMAITGLTPGTNYRFIVLGQNKLGQGPWSEPSSLFQFGATTPAVLAAPTASERAHGVRVEWSIPSDWQHVEGLRARIKVLAYKQSETPGCADCLVSFDADSKDEERGYMMIKDVDSPALYNFRVAGFSAVGMGQVSAPSEVVDTSHISSKTTLFTVLWIASEVMIIVGVSLVILLIWRRKKKEVEEEARVKYMELSPMMEEDLETGSGLGSELGSGGRLDSLSLAAEPPIGAGSARNATASIQEVLADPLERTQFRDCCAQEGLVGYFKFYQAVEDLHRCSNAMSAKSHCAEIQSTYLAPNAPDCLKFHNDTLYQVQNALDFGENPRDAFDEAQREALSTLKLLVYRTFMCQRHHLANDKSQKAPPLDESFSMTHSPLYKTIVRMLSSTSDKMKLLSLAEEVDSVSWLEFFICVEKFRMLEVEQMPREAHDIVEKFMAADSGLRLDFSPQVQQELINTAQPHQSMFDRAQREAFHVLVHLQCLESPASWK
eukprot:TRINITY_DN8959_c0_g4_i6.p1 TRINITY_DN8959_c0_g4~~TRINITY_DN8959_c0_g4_i6.p1  ORF type:complete len:817 (+),score=186.26 TRINITY_DN8959_c0_g4_i6:858-3308(+)